MKFFRRFLAVLLLAIVAFEGSALTLKIGSLAPIDTPWDNALRKLAAEWKEISGGRVTLKIYPGGIAGDESDMIRKIRIGQLDGAALSGTGLNRITPQMLVMALPMLFSGYDELRYVMQESTADFEKLTSERGFELVAWTIGGWIRFFAKSPIVYPDDLRSQRLAVSADDEEILYAWRAIGFDAIPLHPTEIMAGLQSGMAEAFHVPALLAAVYQWFALTPYMSAIDLAPLIAGLVVGERSWKRVPVEYKDELIAAAQGILDPLFDDVEALDNEAIQVMIDNGLTINEVNDEAMAEWQVLVEKGHEILIGQSISPEIYEKILGYRDEYRQSIK